MKTLAHYRTDLRVDLKDSGSVWSDAELDRCVERAVGDLTRFLPREKQLELYFNFTVDDESFTTPQASDDNYFVTSWDISAVSDGAAASIAASIPDVPRPVMITVTDANTSITQLVLIVKGIDKDGRYMEEFFYLSGGLVQTGVKYFATITAVEIERIQGGGAADTIIVGTGSHLGVFVDLVNKPIKYQTDTITSYTREEDYTIDYAQGRIALITGTTMAANTDYTIDYDKSKIAVDLKQLAEDLVRIERVEYPLGQMPQEHAKFEMWGTVLTLAGGFETQKEGTDDQHLTIFYLASHSAPTLTAPGSFPPFLDFTVQLAAAAYALFIEALQYEQQSVTDFASARTTLGSLSAIHTLTNAALDKVITYLENNTNEDSKYWLTKITTDIADLRTAILTALNAANTYLDEVDTTDLGQATVGAEAYLEAGDNFIDATNDGARVPENYREYSQARAEHASVRANAAIGFIQEASLRLSNLRSYIEQAAGWGEVAKGFVEEATGRIAEMDRHLAEAQQYNQIAQGNLELADRLRQEGAERRNEAWAIWSSPHQIASGYTLGQRSQSISE